MKKEEFLRRLEELLMNVSESDRLDAIAYYSDYFDEAGEENEQIVIRELGSPEKVADTIRENLGATGYNTSRDYDAPRDYEDPRAEKTDRYESAGEHQSSGNYTAHTAPKQEKPWFWILLVVILTFPFWIGIVAGLFGCLVGLLGCLLGITVALMASGIGIGTGGVVCFVVGIFRVAATPAEGIITIGVGALMIAVALLLLLLFAWLAFKWIPEGVKAIVKWVKGLFHRNEGGDMI